ncbi:putative adenylate cyclase [Gordonia spumicola]|uniref:Putative adenylate cyclase n=1 Tax=Gordonia spumicola TaxID=589161 RepID=A0A7I9V8H1_9ACTN|nr:adenylate/guanylate cyclase domain-containing protein [Gordonia spumicola]GEE01617.1 putative adenylate cyclase [Gordonia spumicola]
MSDDPVSFSREELVDALHLDHDYALRFWNAFGFAQDTGASGHRFTREDLAALAIYVQGDNAMDTSAQLAAARSIGQATARLAEWQAEQIRLLSANDGVAATTDQMIDALAHLQTLVWRRHLESYMRAPEAADHEVDTIVGFADIVGYTSMSRQLGMADLENLLERFESSAHTIVVENGGQVVKTIGDAVMFTSPDARAAAETAVALHVVASDGEIPALRIGIARGHALTRLGDVFGEPVNIAARLAGSARSGTTLVDENLSEDLKGDERFYVSSIPTLSVRGYRRLHAWSVVRNRHWDERR